VLLARVWCAEESYGLTENSGNFGGGGLEPDASGAVCSVTENGVVCLLPCWFASTTGRQHHVLCLEKLLLGD